MRWCEMVNQCGTFMDALQSLLSLDFELEHIGEQYRDGRGIGFGLKSFFTSDHPRWYSRIWRVAYTISSSILIW